MARKKAGPVIRVAELFAGVGGFRLGLERASGVVRYQVVFSNQWEPARRKQHASDIYVARFGADGHSNQDIATGSGAAAPAESQRPSDPMQAEVWDYMQSPIVPVGGR